MQWTAEAEASLKKAPPFVRKMARKAVESHALENGVEIITGEVLEEVRAKVLKQGGKKGKKKGPSLIDKEKYVAMKLDDSDAILANETGDPLHYAFDTKMSVHAMPKGDPVSEERLHSLWREATSSGESLPARTIYVHIPFCETKCLFCGFFQNPHNENTEARYVDALAREMELTANTTFAQARPFRAVYFGGGTPTALKAEEISRLVATVKRHFPLANDCEITVEGRIKSFTPDKIHAAIDAGVNRFSIGVQTFDTKIRQSLGRRESCENVIERLGYIRDLGSAAVVIDMIYGLPGQTMEIWENDIRTFIDLRIDGCDQYQLNLFRGGRLDKKVEKGEIEKPVPLHKQGDYFARGIELMEAAHYRRLSNCHWASAILGRERSLYNSLSRGRSECVPIGSGAGGWVRSNFFFVGGDTLESYFDSIERGVKPISYGISSYKKDLLFRDISYQIELGYCDFKKLADDHRTDVKKELIPIVSQWETAGLVKQNPEGIILTLPGQFWAVNLAQIIINTLEKKMD